MGCCASDSGAAPDVIVPDHEDVVLVRPIRRATLGPEKQHPHDVTQALRNLYAQGHTNITGGIHTAIGNPYPGQKQLLKLWYLDATPDAQWADGAAVELRGIVCYATCGPADAPAHDVTEAIKSLQKVSRNSFPGGIQAAIGDSHPGQQKTLQVWYTV